MPEPERVQDSGNPHLGGTAGGKPQRDRNLGGGPEHDIGVLGQESGGRL